MKKIHRLIIGLVLTGLTIFSSTINAPIVLGLMVLLPYALYFYYGKE